MMDIEYTDTEFKGGEVTRITDHAAADVLPVFSPDGTKLMWTATKRGGDDAAQLWIADWKLSN
jgi:Tol biopolymer transport system component